MTTQAQMKKRVESFITTERTSKAELSKLSRDLLTYVYESNDSPMLNRLIDGLTPANKRVACQFFPKFLGWDWDKDNSKFGKKSKDKIHAKKLAEFQKEMENPDFNMWSWYEAKGVKPEKAPKDHKKAVGNAIKSALTDKENPLSVADLGTILFAQGVSMRDLMTVAENYANIQALEGK